MLELTAQLAKARAAVRKETFGTPEWEAAMVTVRALCTAISDATPRFEHTSVDGDIFDRRAA